MTSRFQELYWMRVQPNRLSSRGRLSSQVSYHRPQRPLTRPRLARQGRRLSRQRFCRQSYRPYRSPTLRWIDRTQHGA